MHTALKQCKVNDKFQDTLFLFLELVRAGVLHGNLWSGRAYSGGPSFGTGALRLSHSFVTYLRIKFGLDEEKKCMLLIMRVLSIVPLTFKVRGGALLVSVGDVIRVAVLIAPAMEWPSIARALSIQLVPTFTFTCTEIARRAYGAKYATTATCPPRTR